MSKRKYFVEPGQRFGRLIIIGEINKKDYRNKNVRYVKCICDCGNEIITRTAGLFFKTVSCGCFNKEQMNKRRILHGKSHSYFYKIFMAMINRCYNEKSKQYKSYGGRDIKICDEWLGNPSLFIEWAEKSEYKKGLLIERKDNNKGYSPDNCAFVNRIAQANNKRNNHIIEYCGDRLTMINFCRKYNLNYFKFAYRVNFCGVNIEKAMINCGIYIHRDRHKFHEI